MKKLLPVLDPATQAVTHPGQMSDRSFKLTAFALTGFANFASIGIQLAASVRSRVVGTIWRGSAAALFVGFVATLQFGHRRRVDR